jgi:hypothetical protein
MEPLTVRPPGMDVGWWISLPVEEDGSCAWTQIGALMPPEQTGESRWAIRVRRGHRNWWVKADAHLQFRVCDVDPT